MKRAWRPWMLWAAASITALLLATCSTMKVYRITKLDFPNKSGKLKNGLKIVIQPDDSVPYAMVVLRYAVGAGHDPKDKKGLAHLIEHLAFRVGDELVDAPLEPAPAGTKKKAKKGKFRIERFLVAENAWTNFDETVYHNRVVPFHVEDVLKDLAEQMGDFSSQISQDVFETERNVVRNERRSSHETRPLDRASLDLFDRLFPKEHPYQGHGVIGSHETIANIEISDVSAYLKAHYHAANATLVVQGNVDPDATLAMIMKHFGDKPKREPSVLTAPAWNPESRTVTVVVPEAKETMITVVWPLGPRYSEEVEAAKILRDQGWFWWRLVHNRGWAYWTGSSIWQYELNSLFVVRALLKHHDDADRAIAKIIEIAELLDSELSKTDVAQSRRRRIYRKLYGAEGPRDRAVAMARYFNEYGRPMAWTDELAVLNRLEYAGVAETGRKILDSDRALILIHTPIREGVTAPQGEAAAEASYTKEQAEKAASSLLDHDDRQRLPPLYDFDQPFAEFTKWVLDDAEHWDQVPERTLANGLQYRIIERGDMPIMFARTAIRGGQLAEPPEKYGVGSLMIGAMGLSGRADRERGYRIGVDTYSDVHDETITYGQKFLSVYAEQGLGLLAAGLTSPRFLRSSVIEERDAYVQRLEDSDRDVDTLAARAFWKARGMERFSPYTTKKTVGDIGLFDVRDYYDHVVYPENTMLTVASNLPAERVAEMVQAAFGGWEPAARDELNVAALIDESSNRSKGGIVVVQVPGSAQSKVMLGFDAYGWSDWQQTILASAVVELLDDKADRLREAMGVTYGAQAFNWAWQEHGVVGISTKVEHAATDRALNVLLRVVEQFRDAPLTDDQVDFARRTLMTEFTNAGHTMGSASETHLDLMIQRRPRGFRTMAIKWIAELSKEQIQTAVTKLLGSKPTLVIAGKHPKVPKDRRAPYDRFPGPITRYTAADLL